MSNQYLKIRRSNVPGKKPDTGSLDLGELALNTYDGNLFIKKSGSNGEEIITIGELSTSFSGSFSGSFTGSLLGTSSFANTASFAPNYLPINNTASMLDPYMLKISSSLFVGTGSFNNFTSSYNTGSFTGNFTGSLLGTASFAILSNTSSVNILQSNILTNQTVGGISSGTTIASGSSVESILRQILITYIPPTLSGLIIKSGSVNISTAARDVGNSFIINSASFNATVDNPNGIYPLSSSFTGSNADIGTFTYYFGNNVLNSSNNLSIGSNFIINKTTAGAVTFTVNGRRFDNNSLITGATTSINFQLRNYLVASSTNIINNSTAQSVIDNNIITSTLASSKTWTATCNSNNDILGNYTYLIYPASYGDLSNVIQNGALSVLSAFTKLGDYTITNSYGVSILVRIYKTNSDKAFASGTTLAIS